MTARRRLPVLCPRRLLPASFVTIMILATSDTAIAQGPVALGIGGGVTVPRDRIEAATEQGYHGLLSLRLGVPVLPVHARLDALHARLRAGPSSQNGRFEISALTANLAYDVVPLPVASIYVIGGAGYYWTSWEEGGETRVRDTGWNAGAGLRFSVGGAQLFGEARYHSVSTGDGEVHFIPLTVGVIF